MRDTWIVNPMTRNQRLSRALMYRLIGEACATVSIVHVGIGRYGVACLLMTIVLICAFFTWFNNEEAKYLERN